MKTNVLFSVAVISIFVISGCASTSARYPASGSPGHRSVGTPDKGRDQPVIDHSGHPVQDNNGHDVHAPVIQDHRPAQDIRNDPHMRQIAFRDVHVVGHWDNYYPRAGWFAVWGVSPGFRWNSVTSVVCEAVNTTSNEVYPTSGLTESGWAWSDATVNTLLGQALDDCDTDPAGARDVNGNISCVAANPACTPTYASVYH